MSLREPTAPALPSWVRTAAPVGVGILGLVAWVLYVDVAAAAPRMLPSPIAIAQEFVLRWNIIAEGMAVTATNAFVGLTAGSLIAIALAALAAAIRPIDGMLAPLVAALAVIPIVAMYPASAAITACSASAWSQLATCASSVCASSSFRWTSSYFRETVSSSSRSAFIFAIAALFSSIHFRVRSASATIAFASSSWDWMRSRSSWRSETRASRSSKRTAMGRRWK